MPSLLLLYRRIASHRIASHRIASRVGFLLLLRA